jgi:hypothetical protein
VLPFDLSIEIETLKGANNAKVDFENNLDEERFPAKI